MLTHKRYMEIENLKHELAILFHEGDEIIIQEKIDGANASFQYNSEEDCIDCFSRNQPLTPQNNLRGFYEWVQQLDKAKVQAVLGENLRMFGEWLVSHTVKYPESCYNNLYCFDIFNMETKQYLPQHEVKQLVEQLGLHYVPVFFEGKFTKWEDYTPLVGKTELGGEIGEGIIIKNMSALSHDVIYTKIVHEKFLEVNYRTKYKKKLQADLAKNKEYRRLTALAKTIVTRQRVEKLLYKLVDEGILPEDFSRYNMKDILRNLPSAVYYDCLKEKPEIVNQIENFGKYSGAITKIHLKEILAEREQKHG